MTDYDQEREPRDYRYENSLPPRQRRRQFLHSMGALLVTVPFVPVMLGCAKTTPSTGSSAADLGSGDAGADLRGANPADAGADAGLHAGFATTGTAALGVGYPDPFAEGLGAVCALYPAATMGPCHALAVDRQDLSEGLLGLPVRMTLLVVDAKCQPVPGASVEIWHAGPGGLYSGADAAPLCTSGDATALAGRWLRGLRTTNEQGRVVFDTLYPGWYPGRTVHVHVTVRIGGTEFLTSQLFFDDALNEEIIATQPLYKSRGPKDTSNSQDKVLVESGLRDFLFGARKMGDGTLQAWKALAIQL